jgi:glycosyltransferase involved in cell wall biosynthesis
MKEKKVLLIGPNIPRECGIASHVFQLEKSLKSEGCTVDILSPKGCEGNFHENLIGGFKLLRLLKYVKNYERVNIHFVPEEYFYVGYSPLRLFNLIPMLAFLILFKAAKNILIVIHEPPLTKYFFQRSFIHKYIWKQVPQISFFTKIESETFEKRMGISFETNQCIIEKVSSNFQTFANVSKIEARSKLNIDPNKIIFSCLGFIAEPKGYDRIAKIFSDINLNNSILYILGSVRIGNDERSNNYFVELNKICDSSDNVTLLNKFLSYEDFDLWTIASDYIAFPYRKCSNSGVVGRAKILNKTVIASNVGGLSEQIDSDDYLFSDDTELKNILIKINDVNQN